MRHKIQMLAAIDDVNQVHNVSRGHLMKVVNTLTRSGLLIAHRGRNGGLKLARSPESTSLAEVLAHRNLILRWLNVCVMRMMPIGGAVQTAKRLRQCIKGIYAGTKLADVERCFASRTRIIIFAATQIRLSGECQQSVGHRSIIKVLHIATRLCSDKSGVIFN